MKKAFTLIELLVVIAIFAVLCAAVSVRFRSDMENANAGNSIEKTEIQKPGDAKTSTYTCTIISD